MDANKSFPACCCFSLRLHRTRLIKPPQRRRCCENMLILLKVPLLCGHLGWFATLRRAAAIIDRGVLQVATRHHCPPFYSTSSSTLTLIRGGSRGYWFHWHLSGISLLTDCIVFPLTCLPATKKKKNAHTSSLVCCFPRCQGFAARARSPHFIRWRLDWLLPPVSVRRRQDAVWAPCNALPALHRFPFHVFHPQERSAHGLRLNTSCRFSTFDSVICN